MDSETLLKRLAEMRAQEPSPAHRPVHAGELTFDRARALSIAPEAASPSERAHLENCPACRKLVRDFADAMPHPPWWALLLWTLGRASSTEQQVLDYHVRQGGCSRCRVRLQPVESVRDSVVRFLERISLHHPQAVSAASAGALDVSAASPNGELRAELVELGPQTVLTVRVRDAGPSASLVGFVLRGTPRQDPVTGYLAMGTAPEGGLVGRHVFDGATLFDRLSGECCEVVLSPVAAESLGTRDLPALQLAWEHQAKDAAGREAWQTWAVGASSLANVLEENIREFIQGLAGQTAP